MSAAPVTCFSLTVAVRAPGAYRRHSFGRGPRLDLLGRSRERGEDQAWSWRRSGQAAYFGTRTWWCPVRTGTSGAPPAPPCSTGLVGALVIGRTAAGVVRYMQGNYEAAAGDFHWPHPGIPSSLLPYVPGLLVVILGLLAVMAGPLLMAGRSPTCLYRPEEIGIGLADVVGAGAVVEEVVKTLNLFLGHARSRTAWAAPPGAPSFSRARRGRARPTSPRPWRPRPACRSCSCRRRRSSPCTTGRPTARYGPISGRCSDYARREGGAIGFIEEIDAIGAARGGLGAGPGREGIAGVVNELLIQLQSFDVPPLRPRVRNAFIDAINRWLPPSRIIAQAVL